MGLGLEVKNYRLGIKGLWLGIRGKELFFKITFLKSYYLVIILVII